MADVAARHRIGPKSDERADVMGTAAAGRWTDWQSRLLRELTEGNLVADGTAQTADADIKGGTSCQPPLSI